MRPNLKQQLDQQTLFYNQVEFIESDPISIPHQFVQKQDIEVSAFLVSTIAWGNRKAIIRSGLRIIDLMNHSPYDFVMGYNEADLKQLRSFVHRTFNGQDLIYFIQSLRNIYLVHGGLENVFAESGNVSIKEKIIHFRRVFFELGSVDHSTKHISNPAIGSAAKRINMFLRWMVRNDNIGVDFGLWKQILPEHLMCPLDIHSGRTARSLGLLNRKSNDWRAVEELTAALRIFNPTDPVVYDFALFGMSLNKKL